MDISRPAIALDNSISDSVPGVNGENVSALTALAAEKVDLENGADEEASAEGRAILDEKAVDVAEIADAGKGKVAVRLTDGRTVDAAKLSFPEDGKQITLSVYATNYAIKKDYAVFCGIFVLGVRLLALE